LIDKGDNMIDIPESIRRLKASTEAIRLLVQDISDEQAQWEPDPDSWPMQKVIEHLYNEERIDFRKHLREMFSDPPQPWGHFHQEDFISLESCRQALEGFLLEREESIEWLEGLSLPDWNITSEASFGLEEEKYVFSAGDVLASWVAHDYLHIRQINELLYAWNEKQALPYSVQYAGGW